MHHDQCYCTILVLTALATVLKLAIQCTRTRTCRGFHVDGAASELRDEGTQLR
jgi:hypothetical protein